MVFTLTEAIIFPSPEFADDNGLLAIGGDLSTERIIAAYEHGIFPWFSDDGPILWWSPDPRFVLYPDKIHVSKSMRQILRRNAFSITYDEAFADVIQGCRRTRKGQDGTWITDSMAEAYIRLHDLGLAHSVEAWQEGSLAGGLYGVSLGRMFFGESMFSNAPNASKAALITLCSMLQHFNFDLIDCQFRTEHLTSLGGESISREEFLDILTRSIENNESIRGSWNAASFRNALN